jgi:hypothetical protein
MTHMDTLPSYSLAGGWTVQAQQSLCVLAYIKCVTVRFREPAIQVAVKACQGPQASTVGHGRCSSDGTPAGGYEGSPQS